MWLSCILRGEGLGAQGSGLRGCGCRAPLEVRGWLQCVWLTAGCCSLCFGLIRAVVVTLPPCWGHLGDSPASLWVSTTGSSAEACRLGPILPPAQSAWARP